MPPPGEFEDEAVQAEAGVWGAAAPRVGHDRAQHLAQTTRRTSPRPTRREAIGTPLDRVLTTVIVSALALPPGECQHSDGQVRHPRRRIDLVATSDS
ncbi:hypothetical protein GCM10014715_03500 [Streptomyces spiralis]|uniref:Uncharacterized protein n=1 Tax=Streptomyces spiralis TaxID=66376 RepID=A0A918ZHS4_9ACTN|nr:hypothetical protein GCM10014715_03500 [Streptomyces spiralis]